MSKKCDVKLYVTARQRKMLKLNYHLTVYKFNIDMVSKTREQVGKLNVSSYYEFI